MFNRYRNMREFEHYMRYNTADVPGAYKWKVLAWAIGALIVLAFHIWAITDCVDFNDKCKNYQEVTLEFRLESEQKIYRSKRWDDEYYHIYFQGEEKPYLLDVTATYAIDDTALFNTRAGDVMTCFIADSDNDKYAGEILCMRSDKGDVLTFEDYKSAYTLHFVLWIAGSGLVFVFFAISAVSTAVRKGAGEPEFRVRRR